jgi:hypothetical protein
VYIKVFSEAMLVVAPHGGTLANLLFSRGGGGGGDEGGGGEESGRVKNKGKRIIRTQVLELLPVNRPIGYFG